MLLLTLLISNVLGHGRLTNPIPRFGTGSNNGADNGPVSGPAGDDFVCRHTLAENTQPLLDLTAGQELTLTWDFSAAHVGDCSLYVTYDVNADRPNQKWFKIANMYKCRDQNNQNVPITLPAWLPAGTVTIRWDWWGLHQFPGVEYYSQCFDANVAAGSNPVPLGDIFKYEIPNLMPVNGNTDQGFRNPFNGGAEGPMTGPPCALNYKGNGCEHTACGTEKFIDVKGSYTGSGRRRLCADIKTAEECTSAMSTWDACGDVFWSSQCELSCGICSSDSGNNDSDNDGNSGGDSGNSANTGDSSVVAAGCESYAYTYDSGSNDDSGSNGNDNSGSNDDDASAALPVTIALLTFALVFV